MEVTKQQEAIQAALDRMDYAEMMADQNPEYEDYWRRHYEWAVNAYYAAVEGVEPVKGGDR
jgi:hypothetical protein